MGMCPVELTDAFVTLCAAQSCGKCVPCRVGLAKMHGIMAALLDGAARPDDLLTLERTARTAYASADCAIGYEAGAMVLRALEGFRDDFRSHADQGRCTGGPRDAVPCVAGCPAHVDIPGYVALVNAGRYDDAVRLIRKDNPFALACGLICEHPCELGCRRGVVDDAVNIRALKRYAVDHAPAMFEVSPDGTPAPASAPARHEATGKRIAVVGGGLAGCECALRLARAGLDVTLFEQKPGFRSPAHVSDCLAELVCSNSLRSDESASGVGLLKAEMRALDSDFMSVADACRVPAGKALAVDREAFARAMTARVAAQPRIRLVERRISALDDPALDGVHSVVIAAGPLASEELSASLAEALGTEHCYFYDAIAPIVWTHSLDMNVVFRASRYGCENGEPAGQGDSVSYTHLRAHET